MAVQYDYVYKSAMKCYGGMDLQKEWDKRLNMESPEHAYILEMVAFQGRELV
jgi:hypothetical protein